MNESQLCKAWTTIGLFTLIFSLDSWMRVQGSNPIFGSSLPHKDGTASALLGFFIVTIGIIGLLRISFAFTSRQPSGNLPSRLPIAFFDRLDTSEKDAILYQRFMYFLFHIFPLLASIHFIHIILSSNYYIVEECKKGLERAVNLWVFPENYVWDNGYRLGSCDGVTFFPGIQPGLLLIIGFFIVGLNIHYFFKLRQ